MRRKEPEGFWQSYADLAMGLMSVFVLLLILLLVQKEKTNAGLEKQQRDFAKEMIKFLGQSQDTIRRQNEAATWLSGVFTERGCDLVLDDDGALHLKGKTAELYPRGNTALTEDAQRVLKECADNFYRLMRCLAPTDDAKAECDTLEKSSSNPDAAKKAETDRAELRSGLEALVLQGNTDREPLKRTEVPVITGAENLAGDGKVFSDNAFLGAERARQALGHLMRSIQSHDQASKLRDKDRPLEIMMSRVRIESPSFGQYLAGPVDKGWRVHDPKTLKDVCRESENNECEQARNLSLKIRWTEKALRKPYEDMKQNFCRMLVDPESAVYKGLASDPSNGPEGKPDPNAPKKAADELGCEPTK